MSAAALPTNIGVSLLLMCWEGGWEWARLAVALDVRGLDSYSYSYSLLLLLLLSLFLIDIYSWWGGVNT